MLLGLSVRSIVLVDGIDMELGEGLTAVTGETGAGKSVLLEALGLALGARANSNLIRRGEKSGWVSASFKLSEGHPALHLLDDHELEAGTDVILRRTTSTDGRSRAFVNDQPISVALLRKIGSLLVQIHGHADHSSFTDVAYQRDMLDTYGQLTTQVDFLGNKFDDLRNAERELSEAKEAFANARTEEGYLRYSLDELDALAPKEGEEEELAKRRKILSQADHLLRALEQAQGIFTEENGVCQRLSHAQRDLGSVTKQAEGKLDGVVLALSRVSTEIQEASSEIDSVVEELRSDPSMLEEVESRLFSIRALARKHHVDADRLCKLRDELAERADSLNLIGDKVAQLEMKVEACRGKYGAGAQELSEKRRSIAKRLGQEVIEELGPLKLGHIRFEVSVETLPESQWTRVGADRVNFNVATLPGSTLGPIVNVASGGELSRLMLAIMAVLSNDRDISTLIFDEVDRGVGGATAEAVGYRLSELAEQRQVFVITHSPQVAARARHHWRATKILGYGRDGTEEAGLKVEYLNSELRREEIARMLAGKRITQAAREAAESLIKGYCQ
tara:strand:- start:1031 stop:2716 length:1686 start_codon:yes stop_codon:yes gene_type:complete